MIKKIVVLTILVLTLSTLSYAQKSFGPEKGWLVIDGGKEPLVAAITNRFVTLAGGPEANIVLVTTAMHGSDKEEQVEIYKKWIGAKNITVLDTRDRAVANSEAFVEPLRKATGVWFTGGTPGYISDTYVDTLTQRELNALLARGRVIGGSSAGAFLLGAVAAVPFKRARSGAFAEVLKAFGFLPNIFILPHVLQMNWENRMTEYMSTHPGLLGIGVDAGAALVVHGNECEVIGDSKVLVPNGSGADGKGYEVLSAGARFDLAQAMKAAKVRQTAEQMAFQYFEQPSAVVGTAVDLTGTWTGKVTDIDPKHTAHVLTINLKADPSDWRMGSKVTGTVTGPPHGVEQPITNGRIEGHEVSWEVSAQGPDGGTVTFTYKGKISGNQMTGTMSSPSGNLSFTAARK
jgi:cyanophycinase